MLQEAEKEMLKPKYRRELPSGVIRSHPTPKTMTMQCVDTNIYLTLSVPFFVSYSRVDCVCASVHELIMDSNMISSSRLIFIKIFIKIP